MAALGTMQPDTAVSAIIDKQHSNSVSSITLSLLDGIHPQTINNMSSLSKHPLTLYRGRYTRHRVVPHGSFLNLGGIRQTNPLCCRASYGDGLDG